MLCFSEAAFAAVPTEEEEKQILFDLPEKYNDGRTCTLGNSAGYVRLKDITSPDVTFEELQRSAETYLFTLKAGSEAVGYLSVKHQNGIWDVNGSEASYLTDRMEYYDTDCIVIMADNGSYLVSEDGRFCFLDAWKSTVKLDTFEELMLCVSYESVTALERSYSNISSEAVYDEAFLQKAKSYWETVGSDPKDDRTADEATKDIYENSLCAGRLKAPDFIRSLPLYTAGNKDVIDGRIREMKNAGVTKLDADNLELAYIKNE